MASRVNLGMGGSQKKSPVKKKSSVKRKTNGQGVKMKSKGGAMGGKKDLPPGMQMGGAAERDKKKKIKSKGYAAGGKVGMGAPKEMKPKPTTGGSRRPSPTAPAGSTKVTPTSPKAAQADYREQQSKKRMKDKRIKDAVSRGGGRRGRGRGGI
jgi:hypothetical protein